MLRDSRATKIRRTMALSMVLWGAFVAAVCPADVYAQLLAPRLIPFQARLTDTNGATIPDNVYKIVLNVYDQPTGGTSCWTEGHDSVSVIAGQVNVLLGSLTPFDDPNKDGSTADALNLDPQFQNCGAIGQPACKPCQGKGDRYLGITVGASAQEMVPRHQLIPAFHARTAGTASAVVDGGVKANMIADNAVTTTKIPDGALTGAKIADSTLSTAKLANDAVTTAKIAAGAVTGDRLAANSVTTDRILNGTITAADIAPGVLPGAVAGDRVLVRRATDQNFLSTGWDSPATDILPNTEVYDVGGLWTSSAPAFLTAQRSGTYMVQAAIYTNYPQGVRYLRLFFDVNESSNDATQFRTSRLCEVSSGSKEGDSSADAFSTSCFVDLAAGDRVRARLYVFAGSEPVGTSHNITIQSFGMYLVNEHS